VARLKAAGRALVDEEAIFQAVAQQREIAGRAAARSRAARRRLARIRKLSLDPVTPRTVPAITSAPDPSDDDVFPVTRLDPVTRW
jgi:putative transposase